MERKPVKSSNVASVGYDARAQVLEVEFLGGGVYQYADVPPDKYVRLLAADSVGVFLAAEIKGKHAYHKVPPPQIVDLS